MLRLEYPRYGTVKAEQSVAPLPLHNNHSTGHFVAMRYAIVVQLAVCMTHRTAEPVLLQMISKTSFQALKLAQSDLKYPCFLFSHFSLLNLPAEAWK